MTGWEKTERKGCLWLKIRFLKGLSWLLQNKEPFNSEHFGNISLGKKDVLEVIMCTGQRKRRWQALDNTQII